MVVNKFAVASAFTCGLLFAVPAMSAVEWTDPVTWAYFGKVDNNGGSQGGDDVSPGWRSYGNEISMTRGAGGGFDLVATGWSDTGNGKTLQTTAFDDYDSGVGTDNRIEGISASSPDHSIDSYQDKICNGDHIYAGKCHNGNHDNIGYDDEDKNYEAVLLSFDEAVNITDIGISWAKQSSGPSNKVDISLLAYKPTTNPNVANGTGSVTGFSNTDTWAGIVSGDWGVVGNYNNMGTGYFSAPSDVLSKTWLVSVFNPAFNSGDQGIFSASNGFKLKGVKTREGISFDEGGEVPVPGTAALFLLGVAALGGSRRKKRPVPAPV
tara:strand:+ start:102084 stop:103049 length:966 start_codon:yes stop_codon:yes gene_type:complete